MPPRRRSAAAAPDPPSRPTRSSRASSTRTVSSSSSTRRSTRRQVTPEEEEDDDDDDDDDEQEKEEDDDEEEEQQPVARPTSRRTASVTKAKAAPAKAPARSSRSSRSRASVPPPQADDDSDEETGDEEEESREEEQDEEEQEQEGEQEENDEGQDDGDDDEEDADVTVSEPALKPSKPAAKSGRSSKETAKVPRSRQLIEEDEPSQDSDDEGDATIGARPAEPADPDQSDSVDADATFVAPTRQVTPSEKSTPSHGPRFSTASLATIPSTPTSKVAGTAGVPATPGGSAAPSSRLVIHKLILKDFKSYAGLQTIGPFHKSFSSIVGPNGSGKSNVIDALLFVFGWRANKMRQGKLGELIHSSTVAGRAKPSETKVSVVFREIVDLPGPDAYRVVPKSKLVVSRTAYQNNTSVYHLNGKKSSFTEVTTLLRERGIDLDHKRFLILQGEVESIAQMPPKARNEHEEGLLEYLEDIIGTSRFKEEIDEAGKTADECNEKRGERLSRLKIVQREKDSMEGKKREAESLLRDHNALTQRQSVLWQIYMYECRAQIEKAQSSIVALNEKITTEREKHKDAQANVAELESGYAATKKEWEAMKKDVDRLTKEVEKWEKEDLQLGEKRKHFEGKKKKIAKSMNEDKHHLSEARTSLSSSEEDIDRLRTELEKLESSLETEEASLESIRDSLKGKTGHLSEQIEVKQRDLAPWMARVKEQEGIRDVKLQEVELIKGREQARESDVQDAREKRQEIKDELRQKHEDLKALAEEKEEVAAKLEEVQAEIHELKVQDAKLRSRASAARAKADEAKSTQQASASQSTVLSSLSKQAELGMIKGFHGRLGSLGVIDDKYDVAISTACPGLDSIVVDTVECGQACIEHLRKNNLGRANFILLDSIANLRVEQVQTPENVPRLVDLVRPREPRFLPAFYHQLRDTLVARDLAHANRIAYGAKRWRVVTLDGQLIDKSGTMSGGGTRVARGGMSSKFADAEFSPEQVAGLQQEMTQLEGEAQASAMKLQRKEVELRDLRERPGQIEMEIEKARMAVKVGQKRLEDAAARVEDLKAQNHPDAGDASRLASLQSELEVVEGEISNLRSKTSGFEADIAALQEKILDAGGVRLRTAQSKVDGIKEMMELSSEKMTKAEVAHSKAEKDIAKFESAMERHEASLAELDGEMSGLKGAISDKGGVVSKIRSDLEEKQGALEEKQEERDDLKSRLDESSGTINAFRSLEVEIKQKLDDNQRSLHDNEKRLKHWEEKHDGLELHQVDSYDSEDEDDEDEESSSETESAKEGEDDGEGSEGDGASDQEDAAPSRKQGAEAKTKKSKKRAREEEVVELPVYDDDSLVQMNRETIKAEIVVFEEKVQKGSGNFAILAEYRRREQEFLARAKDLERTTQERDAAKTRYDELRRQRLEEFMAGFGIISSKLKEMYQTITLGGNAELELVDSLDPFSEGILFSVMPPKKSWKNISNLSGGEKTLSSLALVFALHVFKPTPLYVMDEIDAALDFRNVSIVANLIKERTKNAQFVIISLRNNMFELASRLVGIYKTNGQTKSLAVENTELSQAVAEEADRAAYAMAASARKARMFPAPPKTPSSSTVASAQRFQNLQSSQLGMSTKRSYTQLSSVTMAQDSPNLAVPATPLSKTQPTAMGVAMTPAARHANHGLPQTPLVIPQTPRMPKSILARTPRVPSTGESGVAPLTSRRRDLL